MVPCVYSYSIANVHNFLLVTSYSECMKMKFEYLLMKVMSYLFFGKVIIIRRLFFSTCYKIAIFAIKLKVWKQI